MKAALASVRRLVRPIARSKAPNALSPSFVKDSLQCAIYGQKAYLDKEAIRAELSPKRVTFLENVSSDAQCFVVHEAPDPNKPPGDVYVSFRGTSSKRDALADADAIVTEHLRDGIHVHRGFWRQFSSIEPSVSDTLDKIVPLGVSRIVFCGHSLGGALAFIACAVYAERLKGSLTVECYTHGAPRVGNRAFATWCVANARRVLRVVNTRDPVTMVPATLRYEHAGEALCITDDLKIELRQGDTNSFVRRWFRDILFSINWERPIRDHDISIYIDRLEKLAKMQTPVSTNITDAESANR